MNIEDRAPFINPTTLELPGRAKVSKVLAKGTAPPVLAHAAVIEVDGHRELAATDAVRVVRHRVPDSTPLGPIHAEALARIEAGAEHDVEDGRVVIAAKAGGRVIYPAPDVGEFPRVAQLDPEYKPSETVRICLDAELLKGLADALGTKQVVLDVSPNVDLADGARSTVRPVRVLVPGDDSDIRKGLLMPIRPPGAAGAR
jgi:hypothetical protein